MVGFAVSGSDGSGGETGVGARGGCAGWEETAVTGFYRIHFQPLVRQAAVLVGHAAAEEVVQECFIAMYQAWGAAAKQPQCAELPAPLGHQPVHVGAAPPGGGRPARRLGAGCARCRR